MSDASDSSTALSPAAPASPSPETSRRPPFVRWCDEQQGPLLAALAGLLTFLATLGAGALQPGKIGWLIRDDFSQHLMGWLYFRQAPLGFPLGSTPNYIHPLGTSLGYTDSMPWVGLLLRPLSPLLPTTFQYVGPWLCLCLMLQGAAAAWVAQRLGATKQQQACVGALLVLSPTLLSRMALSHVALCTHWPLVLLVGLHLIPQPDARAARQALWLALALCVFTAGIHPVIAVMTLPLAISLCVRTALERQLPVKVPLLAAVACVAAMLGLFFVFGYLGTRTPVGAGGFGEFSADLNTLFNPHGHHYNWSRLLPLLPRLGGQYEGFGYLGAGGLLGALLAAVLLARQPTPHLALWRRWLPVSVLSVGLAFFALSSRVTFLGKDVADLSALYRPVLPWVEAFRSSGRFIWPLYYLVLLGGALVLARRLSPARATLLAGLLLGLQVMDLNLGEGRQANQGAGRWGTPPSPELTAASKGREHLVLYPPQMHDSSGRGCRAGPMDYHRWAYRAYLLGLTFNSGYVTRLDDARAQEYCLGLDADIAAGRLDSRTVYLSIPARVAQLQRIPGTRCTPEDGLWLCVRDAPSDAVPVTGR
ncbi:DUF6311 domain-containing protein [Myxococcus sp. MISCRS1]|uniref:DUF6311 domain-containing protein n=1 Tax=Myxococcus sp. MISCRS1 TaxID=2996786 RepID=UPI0022705673|nr:DUF6311 domain-containing protein [Myxococcus sp. MISCRS1]MCY1001146.1 DUF6311 domain-containing protein [Myxococcus sp. MISCRS1]